MLKGWARVGRGPARPPRGHVRVRAARGAQRAPRPRARPARHQAALPRRVPAAACAPPPRCRRCWRRAASTRAWTRSRCTTTSAGTPSSPPRGRSCAACASCRRRRCWSIERRRPPPRARLLGPAVRRARTADRRGLAARRCARRCASPCAGGWSPTSRRHAALRRAGLEPDRRAARRSEGQRGLATFSIGFEDVGEREGDEFEFSDLVARPSSGPTTTRCGSAATARRRAAGGDRGDERADGLARLRRVLAARGGRAARAQGRPVRPGRRRGARRLLLVPAAAGRRRAAASTPTRRSFFDRDDAGVRALLAGRARTTTSRARSRASGSSGPGATTPVDRALRLDTEVMLVDDPVKRVDNMTMAHGLEARTPFLDHELVELAAACPPELKLADGGKGVLKARRPRRRPRRGDRPPEGLLPRARADPPGGPGARAGRATRCSRPRPASAACSGPRPSTRCSRDPNEDRTNLDGSALWQLGLLELWLQRHVG